MSDRARVTIVVTGMGAVSAAGGGVAELWKSAMRGRSPAAWHHDAHSPNCPRIPACIVRDVQSSGHHALRRYRKMDRSVQLALDAASQAAADARLALATTSRPSVGVVVGTSRGPVHKVAEVAQRQHHLRQTSPCASAYSTLACISGALSMALRAGGPSLTVSAACASSAHAIALGAQQILLGAADVIIAGGAEAPLHDSVIRQLLATGILGTHDDPARACRPFDCTRNGTVLGEGAGFLVLESLASAQRRGARIHARLAGWAMGSDHFHETAPTENGVGLCRVMMQALKMARREPADLDYVNAHGTGTLANDRIEISALRQLFGSSSLRVACSSTKPVTGHCLGASAVLEAIVSIEAMKAGCIPPTANCAEIDPECDADIVIGQPRSGPVNLVLSNSLGFWGNNAALAFATPCADD